MLWFWRRRVTVAATISGLLKASERIHSGTRDTARSQEAAAIVPHTADEMALTWQRRVTTREGVGWDSKAAPPTSTGLLPRPGEQSAQPFQA